MLIQTILVFINTADELGYSDIDVTDLVLKTITFVVLKHTADKLRYSETDFTEMVLNYFIFVVYKQPVDSNDNGDGD